MAEGEGVTGAVGDMGKAKVAGMPIWILGLAVGGVALVALYFLKSRSTSTSTSSQPASDLQALQASEQIFEQNITQMLNQQWSQENDILNQILANQKGPGAPIVGNPPGSTTFSLPPLPFPTSGQSAPVDVGNGIQSFTGYQIGLATIPNLTPAPGPPLAHAAQSALHFPLIDGGFAVPGTHNGSG